MVWCVSACRQQEVSEGQNAPPADAALLRAHSGQNRLKFRRVRLVIIIIIIIIIIKNECHSNIIVDRVQGCSHSKKLRESESESRSSKVV